MKRFHSASLQAEVTARQLSEEMKVFLETQVHSRVSPSLDCLRSLCRSNSNLVPVFQFLLARVRSSQFVRTVRDNLKLAARMSPQIKEHEIVNLREANSRLSSQIEETNSRIGAIESEIKALQKEIALRSTALENARIQTHQEAQNAIVQQAFQHSVVERVALLNEYEHRISSLTSTVVSRAHSKPGAGVHPLVRAACDALRAEIVRTMAPVSSSKSHSSSAASPATAEVRERRSGEASKGAEERKREENKFLFRGNRKKEAKRTCFAFWFFALLSLLLFLLFWQMPVCSLSSFNLDHPSLHSHIVPLLSLPPSTILQSLTLLAQEQESSFSVAEQVLCIFLFDVCRSFSSSFFLFLSPLMIVLLALFCFCEGCGEGFTSSGTHQRR